LQTSEILRQNLTHQTNQILSLQTQLDEKTASINDLEAQLDQINVNFNISQYETGRITTELQHLKVLTEN